MNWRERIAAMSECVPGPVWRVANGFCAKDATKTPEVPKTLSRR